MERNIESASSAATTQHCTGDAGCDKISGKAD